MARDFLPPRSDMAGEQTGPLSQTSSPGGAAPGVPPTVTPGVVGVGANGAGTATEEQRRKWREKGKLQRARKRAALSGSPGVVAPGEALPASAPPPSATLPGGDAPAPIPHDPARLQRLWAMFVPAAEKYDLGKLKALAEQVDPCLVEIVEKEAVWNDVAKSTLIESGPNVSADFLNAIGVGAERVDLVAFGLAAWTIFSGRSVVADKLEMMLEKKKAEEEKTKAEKNHAQSDENQAA